MAVARSIVVGIIGDNKKLLKAIKGSKKSLKGFGGVAAGVFKAGAVAAVGLATAVVGVGAASTKMAIKLNKDMANISTLIPGATERVLELKSGIQGLAIETAKDTSDIAGGVYNVISAFGDTNDTLEITEIAAKGATAGLATTTDAVNLLSAVTKGYGDTSAEANMKASDLAFTTVKLGQTTFPELAASMGKAVPLAVSLSTSQEELFAIMATGTGVTGKAAEVSTQLRGAMQSFLAPTDMGAKLINNLGFANGEAMVKQLGLVDSLKVFTDKAKDANIPLQNYIGSIEGQTLALALTGKQYDVFKEKQKAMIDASGATNEAFNEATNGINETGFTMDQVKIKMQVMSQKIGDFIVPYIGEAMGKLMPVLDDLLGWLEINIPKVIGFFEDVGFYAKLYFGDTTEEIRKMVDDLNAEIPGLAEHVEDYADVVDTAWGKLGQSTKNLGATIKDVFIDADGDTAGLGKAVSELVDGAIVSLSLLVDEIGNIVRSIDSLFKGDFKGAVEAGGLNWQKYFVDQVLNTIGAIGEIWIPDFKEKLNEWFYAIPETFNNWINELVQIGKDIVGSILQGFKDAWNESDNFFIASIRDFLINPIKDALQMHSPSKVMLGIGHNAGTSITTGYAEGMKSSQDKVTKATDEFESITATMLEESKQERLDSITDENERADYLRKQGLEERKDVLEALIESEEEYQQSLEDNQQILNGLYEDRKEFQDDMIELRKNYNQDRLDAADEYNKDMLQIVEDAQKEIADVEENYRKEHLSRQSELTPGGFFGKFETPDATQKSSDFVQNMGDQVAALARYNRAMDALEIRGFSAGIIAEARKGGVSKTGDIEQLVGMSNEDMAKLEALYVARNEMAEQQATEELAGLREISDAQIQEIRETEATKLTERAEQWKTANEELREEFLTNLSTLETETISIMGLVKDALTNALPGIQEEAAKIGDAISSALGLASIKTSLDGLTNVDTSQNNTSNVFNITTPEPLNEREVARQIELAEQRVAVEMAI